MFGILEDVVENVIDVGVGVMTFGEYGNINKKTVSKLIADGVELYTIASILDVGVDVIEEIVKESK